MAIAETLADIRRRIDQAAQEVGRDPKTITLVAATKTQTTSDIKAVIAAGITVCGENRGGEMVDKLAEGAYDGAALHFIGHLQTNKVALVVGRVALLESVGSRRLLEAVNRQGEKVGVVQDILLEVNIANEPSKTGMPTDEVMEMAQLASALHHVRLRGIMCVPPAARFPGENMRFFQETYQLFVDMRTKMEDNNSDIDCLSMGMSRDFEDGIRAGATHVRVGTGIFGPRPGLR